MQVKLYDSNKSAGVVNRENFMLDWFRLRQNLIYIFL